MAGASTVKVQRIDDYRWRIPREGQMRVDGLIFATFDADTGVISPGGIGYDIN